MVVVVGPCLSLSASGLMGKALLFYDTKYGARIRKPKSQFVPPSGAWEVNQVWFKKASDRWKNDLTQEQKWAWRVAYPGICDTARDIFMGKQIELWNLSPQNDLTWPQVEVQSLGDWTYKVSEFVNEIYVRLDAPKIYMFDEVISNTVWAVKISGAASPSEDEIDLRKRSFTATLLLWPGELNYCWGGLRYPNGRLEWKLIGSYQR